jgi:hypothetical protein
MNSDPMSLSTPRIGNGINFGDAVERGEHPFAALLGTLRSSVQPVANSLTVTV